MAKVKIQGNASGTGVLTVTAPNTSTDRTITLPDSTGTLATTADSVGGANGVDFNDNVKARFGTGNDLEIYHNGTSAIFSGANNGGGENIEFKVAGGENALICKPEGAVELYHDNNKKIETTSTGVTVTGATNSTVMPTLNSVSIVDSGSNSNGAYTKWADGTMICTHKLVSSSSAAVQWTYPVAFVSGNVPAFAGTNSGVSPDADGGRILTNASESRTNTYVKFFAFMLSNNGRSTSSFQMSAIGRWS